VRRQADSKPTASKRYAPIGTLPCTDRNETMVRYAIGGLDERVFVSQYRLHLPAEQELQGFLEREQAQMTKQQARRRKKSGKDE